jgi:hypothetical protein
MSTSLRHNELSSTFMGDVLTMRRSNKAKAYQEEVALIYSGSPKDAEFIKLINVENISDLTDFKTKMDEYYYVQPDFFIFKHNKQVENKKRTRVAGCPDLIVEIWSANNSEEEKSFKKLLYSSSPTTEHWYIEQDSNEIICYLGNNRLDNQSLLNVLVTRGGLEFDLRYLAI